MWKVNKLNLKWNWLISYFSAESNCLSQIIGKCWLSVGYRAKIILGGKIHRGQEAGGLKAWGAKGRGAKGRGAKGRGQKARGQKAGTPCIHTRTQHLKSRLHTQTHTHTHMHTHTHTHTVMYMYLVSQLNIIHVLENAGGTTALHGYSPSY